YLTQWTWRSIFWINVPVAIIALVLISRSRVEETAVQDTRLDYRGAVLISGAMGLLVLGFQQSGVWGWSSPATWVSLIVGVLLMVAFIRWELHTPEPLLRLRIFADRGFAADTVVLGMMSVVFVPFFFFASVYSQVSLGKNSSQAGLYLLYFFLGYVIASQVGGRILDRRGARPAIVFGCAISAVGFLLLAGKLTDLSLNKQWLYVAIAGAGIGLMLTPASTDAVNRAPSAAYSEATGITQTARNFGASLGLAVLGTILIHRVNTNVTSALTKAGVPSGTAHRVAASFGLGESASGSSAGRPHSIVHAVQLAFAHSTQTVFYIMGGVMAATFIVAVRRVPRGRVEIAEGGVSEERLPGLELSATDLMTRRGG
ncbi:MAG: MFS transporter, partial [Solirubrobacteraceae bacterium]